MSKNIDIDRNTLKAVLLLFRRQRFHVRHIAREIKVSATTASTILRKLEKATS